MSQQKMTNLKIPASFPVHAPRQFANLHGYQLDNTHGQLSLITHEQMLNKLRRRPTKAPVVQLAARRKAPPQTPFNTTPTDPAAA